MSQQLVTAVCGLDESDLVPCPADIAGTNVLLHRDAVAAIASLSRAASREGITLAVASGYRSFHRQLAIWNSKVMGQRPVLDDSGQPLDLEQLADRDKVMAILRWSALPGASRHHWGSDLDVWDRSAVSGDYRLQLTPDEYSASGPFAHLSDWLATEEVQALGFTRPYSRDCGGVAPEPWHLSFAPLAQRYEQQLSVPLLRKVLETSDLLLKEAVLANLDEIFARYIRVPG